MSGFSVDVIEPLTYDFTGFPSDTGKGNATGKGVVPEPTQDDLRSYGEALQDLFKTNKPEEIAEKVGSTPDSPDNEQAAQVADTLMELTAKLCKDTPSKDDLLSLTPRMRNAFQKWVYKELSDPEVHSVATVA